MNSAKRWLRRILITLAILFAIFVLAPLIYLWYGGLRYENQFRHAAESATRLCIRTGGLCHRLPEEEKKLFEITNTTDIQTFGRLVRISRLSTACMCCGNPTFEFYREDQLILATSFHHGKNLRFERGWIFDAHLEDSSAKAVCEWLAAHGIPGPP